MQNVIHVEAHSTILEYLQASPRKPWYFPNISNLLEDDFFIQFYD